MFENNKLKTCYPESNIEQTLQAQGRKLIPRVHRLPSFPFPPPGCDVLAVLSAYLLSDYGPGSSSQAWVPSLSQAGEVGGRTQWGGSGQRPRLGGEVPILAIGFLPSQIADGAIPSSSLLSPFPEIHAHHVSIPLGAGCLHEDCLIP